MLIICTLLLLCIFSCGASDEDIAQQAAKLFMSKGAVVDEGNPILQQATNAQPFLYMKTAKKIALEALKLDPIMAAKNLSRVSYKPNFRSTGGVNFIRSYPTYTRVETAWEKDKKEPNVFLFYKDAAREIIIGDSPLVQTTYSFKNQFYSDVGSFNMLDMAISPNGRYVAFITKFGDLEIKMVDLDRRQGESILRDIKSEFSSGSLLKISMNPLLKPASAAVRWLNDGKHGYCVCGTDVYTFSFDSTEEQEYRLDLEIERIGQFTLVDPQSIIIKNLSVESGTGEGLYHDFCAIDYTENGKENVFVYSSGAQQPDVYTVKTNFGQRSMLLSSLNNMVYGGRANYENMIMGHEIAVARNLKNLELYDDVTINEQHNTVYLFKNENQNKTLEQGFVPVLERTNFVPDYIKAAILDLNKSIMGLSRVIVKEMVPDAVEQFVEGKYLLLKKDVRKATDTTSIDVDATARDITLKALAIYQKALTQNSLLGSVIPSQPRPQNVVQRMYNRAYTWYAAFSDAAKTRMKWFAGIMVAGAGVLGFTWVHKYNSAAYSKVFQQGQSK